MFLRSEDISLDNHAECPMEVEDSPLTQVESPLLPGLQGVQDEKIFLEEIFGEGDGPPGISPYVELQEVYWTDSETEDDSPYNCFPLGMVLVTPPLPAGKNMMKKNVTNIDNLINRTLRVLQQRNDVTQYCKEGKRVTCNYKPKRVYQVSHTKGHPRRKPRHYLIKSDNTKESRKIPLVNTCEQLVLSKTKEPQGCKKYKNTTRPTQLQLKVNNVITLNSEQPSKNDSQNLRDKGNKDKGAPKKGHNLHLTDLGTRFIGTQNKDDNPDTGFCMAPNVHIAKTYKVPQWVKETGPGQDTNDVAMQEPATLGQGKEEDESKEVTRITHKSFFQTGSINNPKYRSQFLQSQVHLAEVLALTDPLGKALEVTDPGRLGCTRCDPRMSHLLDKTLANHPILKMQLSWQAKDREGGVFMFDRMYRPGFENFPDCKELTKMQTWHTLSKLGNKPHSRAELAYKTCERFYAGHLRWVSQEELQAMEEQKLQKTFLSNLIVVNARSQSTPLRLTLITNRGMKVKNTTTTSAKTPQTGARTDSSDQLKCYNDFIRRYSTEYPQQEYLHLRTQMNIMVSAGDIKSAFDGIQTSLNTSLQNLTYFLKDSKGRPTFDCQGRTLQDLQPAMYLTQSYGASDSPAVFSAVVKSLVEIYKRKGPGDISPELLQFLDKTIRTTTYADDVHCSLTHGDIIFYFTQHPEESEGNYLSLKEPLTKETIDAYTLSLKKLGNIYLKVIWKALIKVFHFSNMNFKRIEVLDPQLRTELNLLNKQYLPAYQKVDLPRPQHRDIMAETRVKLMEKDSETDASTLESKDKAFITQLGRSSFEDATVGLKNKSLVLDKRFPADRAHSFEQFLEILEKKGGKITRRNLYGLLGALSDPLGNILYLAISQMKIACALFLAGTDTDVNKSQIDWEQCICEKSKQQALLAVKIFFLTCQDRLPQGLKNHTAESQFILAGFADAGIHLHTAAVFLLNWCYIRGQYDCHVTRISLKCYINNPKIRSIPFYELQALARLSQELLRMVHYLRQMNVQVHPKNILIFSDSTSAILQVRGRAANLSARAGSMSAKTQLTMHELQINAYENLFFYKQGDPNKPFYADLYSKSLLHLNEQGLVEHMRSLTDYRWLQEHPSQWTQVSRDLVLPMEKEAALLADMEIMSDYLSQTQENLQRNRQMGLGQYDIFSTPKDPKVLLQSELKPLKARGAVPAPTNQQVRDRVQQLALATTGQPIADPRESTTLILNTGTKEISMHNTEFDTLLQRKRAMGLGYRSSIRILAHCLHFIYRLHRISKLAPPQKIQVRKILAHNYEKGFSQNHSWSLCKQMFCGLANSQIKKKNCQAKNPLLHKGYNALQDIPTTAGLITEVFRIKTTCTGKPTTARQTCNGSYCKGDLLHSPHRHCVSYLDPCALGELNFELPTIPPVMQLKPKNQQVQLLKVDNIAPHPQRILQKLKAQCRLMCIVPWNNKSHPKFFDPLAIHVLTCHYRDFKENINQVETFESLMDGGLTCTWLKGREQRTKVPTREDGTKNESGWPVYRAIQPQSVLAQMVIYTAHHLSGCHEAHTAGSAEKAYFLLHKWGFFIHHAKKHLETFRRNCQLCRLQRAERAGVHNPLHQRLQGPSEKLASLIDTKEPQSSWIIDLLGPLTYQCAPGTCQSQLWVLIMVNDIGLLVLRVLQDYSAGSLLLALSQHALEYGSMRYLYSDSGSQLSVFHNKMNTPQAAVIDNPKFDQIWKPLLTDQYRAELKRNCGAEFMVFHAGRHQCVGVAESSVKLTKVVLKKLALFRRPRAPLNLFQFQYILAKVSSLHNSRPLYCHEGKTFCVTDMTSFALGQTSFLEGSGLAHKGKLCENCPKTVAALKRKVSEIQGLTESLMTDLIIHYVPRLLDITRLPKDSQRDQAETLKPGDLCLDLRAIRRKANIAGALSRIVAIGQQGRSAIISRIKSPKYFQSSYLLQTTLDQEPKDPAKVRKQHADAYLLLGRAITDLALVAKRGEWDTSNVKSFFRGAEVYNFADCLGRTSARRHLPHFLPEVPDNLLCLFSQDPSVWPSQRVEEQQLRREGDRTPLLPAAEDQTGPESHLLTDNFVDSASEESEAEEAKEILDPLTPNKFAMEERLEKLHPPRVTRVGRKVTTPRWMKDYAN